MVKYMCPEDLEELIKAVRNYQEKLVINRKVLVNAGNICDQAMGSDDIVKKHLAQLNEALLELDKTISIAHEVEEKLRDDWQRAIIVYDD